MAGQAGRHTTETAQEVRGVQLLTFEPYAEEAASCELLVEALLAAVVVVMVDDEDDRLAGLGGSAGAVAVVVDAGTAVAVAAGVDDAPAPAPAPALSHGLAGLGFDVVDMVMDGGVGVVDG